MSERDESTPDSSRRRARRLFIAAIVVLALSLFTVYVVGPAWIEAPAIDLLRTQSVSPSRPSQIPAVLTEIARGVEAVENVEDEFKWSALLYHFEDPGFADFATDEDPLCQRAPNEEELRAIRALAEVFEPHWTTLEDPALWASLRPPVVRYIEMVAEPEPRFVESTRPVLHGLSLLGNWAVLAGELELAQQLRRVSLAVSAFDPASEHNWYSLVGLSYRQVAAEEYRRLGVAFQLRETEARPRPLAITRGEFLRRLAAASRDETLDLLAFSMNDPEFALRLALVSAPPGAWRNAVFRRSLATEWWLLEELWNLEDTEALEPIDDWIDERYARSALAVFGDVWSPWTSNFDFCVSKFEECRRTEIRLDAHLSLLDGLEQPLPKGLEIVTWPDGSRVLVDRNRLLDPLDPQGTSIRDLFFDQTADPDYALTVIEVADPASLRWPAE